MSFRVVFRKELKMYELIIYIAGILTLPIMVILWELLAIYKKHKKENFEKIKLKKNKASYGQKKKQNKPNDKKAGNNV